MAAKRDRASIGLCPDNQALAGVGAMIRPGQRREASRVRRDAPGSGDGAGHLATVTETVGGAIADSAALSWPAVSQSGTRY
jgi:hypothetical protein